MKRVLLLNPPADPPVSRDYYCGHFTKGRHSWPPVDLLVLSGMLSPRFDVRVLDAVAENLDPARARAKIAQLTPDAVVSLTAAVSWSNDMAFMSRLKKDCSLRILVSGDYCRAEPLAALNSNACIDAVILDFVDNDVCSFLDGENSRARNIYGRDNAGAPVIENSGTFSYPAPRHELFPLKRYRRPQSLRHPGTVVLTDFGCPFACDFCFMERIKHRLRDIGNVSQELARVRELGIREILVADQSFGSHREHALEVCDAIDEAGSGLFSWEASMRVDAVDQELLKVMKRSGCHTIMFGVETSTRTVLDQHRKGTSPDQVRRAFALARSMGFRTLAHFIIGLTGETEKSLKQLVDYAIELDPDIASFNVAAPAWNTSFGDLVRDEGWFRGKGIEIAEPDSKPAWENPGLDHSCVLRIRDEAARRFYMRPKYMLKQLGKIRSAHQLRMLFREGIAMLISVWKKGKAVS